MIIENDGRNDYKVLHMGKESLEWRGLLPWGLDITPTANAWLNPMMEDDSNQDSDDSDDDAHVPTITATPMVEMDGEGGENAATDANGLKRSGLRWSQKIHDIMLDMGFSPCKADPCVWLRKAKCATKYNSVAIYVNDLLIACSCASEFIHTLKRK